MNKYKLVCFDVDGTLATGPDGNSYWETLHTVIEGEDGKKINDENVCLYEKGLINYHDWSERDLESFKRRGATKADFERAAKMHRLMPGALETIRELHERGLKIILVSGSMNTIVDILFPERLFDDSFINKARFDAKGKLVSWKVTTLFDTHGRHKTIKDVCKKEGISPAQTVFVGNGESDILIFGEVGLGIAFCPKLKKVEEVADIVVKKKDLREILKYF